MKRPAEGRQACLPRHAVGTGPAGRGINGFQKSSKNPGIVGAILLLLFAKPELIGIG
jgi:hypothetical protein